MTEVEVKRCGALEEVPTASEDLSAGTFVGGEEGDDLAYDFVGQAADVVHTFSAFTHAGIGCSSSALSSAAYFLFLELARPASISLCQYEF